MTLASTLYAAMDDLIARVGEPERSRDVAQAREEFDRRRGRTFEDEALWESWTQAFLEWYSLEHRVDTCTLAESVLATELGAERAAAVRAWARSQRALVEVLSVKPGVVEVVDLLRGARFAVQEPRSLHGVGSKDVVEVRLIGYATEVRFGRTFVFHPTGTGATIKKRLARLVGDGVTHTDVMDHFARLRLRCERYAHLPPARIYDSGDDRVPDRGRKL